MQDFCSYDPVLLGNSVLVTAERKKGRRRQDVQLNDALQVGRRQGTAAYTYRLPSGRLRFDRIPGVAYPAEIDYVVFLDRVKYSAHFRSVSGGSKPIRTLPEFRPLGLAQKASLECVRSFGKLFSEYVDILSFRTGYRLRR